MHSFHLAFFFPKAVSVTQIALRMPLFHLLCYDFSNPHIDIHGSCDLNFKSLV